MVLQFPSKVPVDQRVCGRGGASGAREYGLRMEMRKKMDSNGATAEAENSGAYWHSVGRRQW